MQEIVIVAGAPGVDLARDIRIVPRYTLLIAADGGAHAVLEAGMLPDLLVGDLDSLSAAEVDQLAGRGVQVLRHPREKDETDLELALLEAAARGATDITVFGALGGRWDHSLANVALLALPELCGRRVRLVAERQTIVLVRDTLTIGGTRGDTVSLIPFGGAVYGITTGGLLYALDDATLAVDRARGISNVLIDPPAWVRVRHGLLLVVHHDDGGAHQWRGGDDYDVDRLGNSGVSNEH